MNFFSRISTKLAGFTAAFKVKHTSKFAKVAQGEIFVKIHENGVLKETISIGRNSVGIDPETKKVLLGSNIVVLDASTLLARLIKDPSEPAAGVAYFALGTGNPGWDKFNPPAPVDTQTTLEAEVANGRVSPSASTFIDPSTGLPSVTPTNIVDFDFDFSESQAVGFLCEAGLFGGDATSAANSGTMITFKTFPVISKTSTMTISFTYRLTF